MCGSACRGLRASWGTGKKGSFIAHSKFLRSVLFLFLFLIILFLLLYSSYFHSIHPPPLFTDHKNPPSLPQVPIQVCTVVDTEREPIVSTVIGTEYKTGKKGPPKPSKPLFIRYDMSVHVWTDRTCQWLDSEQSNCGNLWQILLLQSLQKRSWPEKVGGASTCRKSRMPHRALFVVRKSKH